MFINIFSFYNKNILLPRKNRGGENYGKTKRRKNRCYSAQEKYNIIKPIISGEISEVQLGKELKLSNGMLVRWIDITESKHYNDSIGCITNEETVSEFRKAKYEMKRLGFETYDEYLDYLEYMEKVHNKKVPEM